MPRTATPLAAALALGVSLALPAGALADGSGGGTSAPDTSVSTGASTPNAASSAGSLKAGRAALLGRWQRVAGTLDGAATGQALLLQRSDGTGWVTVGRATTGKGGGFSARWRPSQIGRFTLRVVLA